jgi:hypothetical protein
VGRSFVVAVIVFSVMSNIFLWMNLWNLKKTVFEFQRKNIEYLKELCKEPTENSSRESTEQTANKV